MRWLLLVCAAALLGGCYMPPSRAKSCASCSGKSGKRSPSYATHVK